MSGEFISIFTASFVTFFVLIDALGVAPVFASLTARGPASYRRSMAIRSVLVGTLIIFGFAFFGAWLLDKLHITIDAFRAAGGILLFWLILKIRQSSWMTFLFFRWVFQCSPGPGQLPPRCSI